MSDITSVSGTLNRTTKQSDSLHPHYFNSFQNYCYGPKNEIISSSTNSDLLPIPERFKIKADEIHNFINGLLIERLSKLTQYTSVLPYQFFEQDNEIDSQRYLIDRTMFKTMNEARVINWMKSLKQLYPVRTSGNGNCLLHAVLMAMVGIHDFKLYLRDRLLQFMDRNKEVLKRSWKAERLKSDKMYGIQSEDSTLNYEWEELCNLVRYENSDDGQTASNLQFLEAVHIFSVSNMLCRPIIILSEDVVRNKHGEAISYNDLFGIYLPVLSRPQDCVPIPIVLAYDQSHFCPLLTNNGKTSSSSDNFLPLYQSIEHMQKQNLLPIRFSGNDMNVEENYKLLQNYLRIKKLSFFLDSNSSIPIHCTELGNKHIPDDVNFFLLYYNYITDFFETQKRKFQEEDEEKRKYEQEYYLPNQTQYENSQRSLRKADNSSSPPPPSYSSLTMRTIDNKNYSPHERRPSYDKAVANGTPDVLFNDVNRLMDPYYEQQQLQKPQSYVHIRQRSPLSNETNYNNGKQQQLSQSDWDSTNNDLMPHEKIVNNSNTNSRGNDSKLKQEQQQNLVRIPVRVVKLDSSSNLIDFEQKTDRIRPCIVCKNYFDDLSSTGLCPKCNYDTKRSPPRQIINIQQPSPNIYSPIYRNSDFLNPLSSPSKIIGPQKIVCPHCRNINMINNVQHGVEYRCSICQTILRFQRY